MKGLLQKIAEREAVVCVIGLGYVGFPLALSFAKAGFRVYGVDSDEERIVELKSGCGRPGSRSISMAI